MSKFRIPRKNFAIGKEKVKRTILIPKPMHEALTELAVDTGSSLPKVVIEGLEEWLTALAEHGRIELPGKEK